MRNVRLLALALVAVSVATGCPQCAPGDVGTGVAQLTMRNLGAVATLVNADDECGFAAASVLSSPTFEGAPGEQGAVIFTVTDCVIDLGESLVDVSEDCEGNKTQAQGKITVTGSRRVTGLLTGDPALPIVPGGPDAVTITFNEIVAEGFRVEKSNSISVLQWNEGSVSGTLAPRLAVAASSGACAIATPITTFSTVVYADMAAMVVSESATFDVDVATSNLSAQNGANGDEENTVSGDITVFGTPVVVDEALDPEYNADDFDTAWQCATDLLTPVSFECLDLGPRLADGAARLTVKAFGTIASIVNADPVCGFATSSLAPVVTGDVGGPGTAVFTITDCTITVPDDTVLAADCTGNSTTVGGTFTVSGTKTVAGVLSGSTDPAKAIIPSSDEPATIALTITPAGFDVAAGENSISIASGTLAGSIKPRTALSTETGACSVSTPNATLTDLSWTDGRASITSASGTFGVVIDSSNIDATNGVVGASENALSGGIALDGDDYTVPNDGQGLDPAYDATAFVDSFTCDPELATPLSFQCDTGAFGAVADGAARLSVKALGTLASVVNSDAACGFSSSAAAGSAVLSGNPGTAGSVTLTITDCTITFPADTALPADCNGDAVTVGGSFTVSGTKTVAGVVSGSADPASVVIPANDTPGTLSLTITPNDLTLDDGTNAITMASGTLAGAVTPRTALSSDTGACSVTTSGAAFVDVTWTDGTISISSPSGTFGLVLDDAEVDATNGVVGASENALSGTVSVNGESYTVPSDGAGLNPDYDAATFADAFACNPELVSPISYTCDTNVFAQLAVGAAALSGRTFGTVVSIVDADTTCGFSSLAVGGTPTFDPDTSVAGDKDVTATFALPVDGCTLNFGPTAVTVSTDCLGNTTAVKGSVVVKGTKSVTGFRSGDPTAPIVPTTRSPATFALELEFSNDFAVISSASTASLTVQSGTLTGSMSPRTGLAVENGTCSIGTPNVAFTGLTWANAVAVLDNDGDLYTLPLTGSALDAQNGLGETTENELSGSISVSGQAYPFGTVPLDPAYDAAVFASTYTCDPELQLLPDGSAIPPSDGTCMQFLAEAAARLLVRNVGITTSALDGNPLCGFATGSPNATPTAVTGNPGEPGSLTFSATGCPVAGPANDFVLATDCNGVQTVFGSGFALTSAEKVVTGLRLADPPIVPNARDAASFTLSSIAFNAFSTYGLAPGQTAGTDTPDVQTTITGTVSASVSPIAGQSISATAAVGDAFPVYSLSTGIAGIDVSVTAPVSMTLVNEGKTFTFSIDSATLTAFNGAYYDAGAGAEVGSNDISGLITVDGIATGVAVGSPLDPAYDQAIFDASYECNPDLAGLVPSAP